MKFHGVPIFKVSVEKYFDPIFYLEQLHKLDIDTKEPWEHYRNTGWKVGYSPSAEFNVDHYWNANTDVFKAGVEPLEHWIKYGKSENRQFKASPWEEPEVQKLLTENFHTVFYLNYNKLSSVPLQDALGHFCRIGWRLMYDPHPNFDTEFYRTFEHLEIDQNYPYFLHYLLNRKDIKRSVTYPHYKTPWDFSNLGMLTPRSRPKINDQESQISSKNFALENTVNSLTKNRFNFFVDSLISWGNNNYMKNSGGVEVVVMRELNECLSASINHIYIYQDGIGNFSSENTINKLNIIINGSMYLELTVDQLEMFLKYLNERAKIGFFHLHGKINSELSDVARIAAYASEKKYLVHDYSFICRSYALMRNDIEQCSAPEPSSTLCQTCIAGSERAQYVSEHQNFLEKNHFSVVSPSSTAAGLFTKTFPTIEIRTQPHLNFLQSSGSQNYSPKKQEKYRIAFTGHSAHHKGWNLFELFVRHAATRNDFECFHFGNGPKTNNVQFIRVNSFNGESNMESALLENEIDVVFQWSLWPETFSIVTAEALAAGCLVITNPGSGNLHLMAGEHSRSLVYEDFQQLIEDHNSGALKAEVERRKHPGQFRSLNLKWNSFVDLADRK
jgi:hypothetical protein